MFTMVSHFHIVLGMLLVYKEWSSVVSGISDGVDATAITIASGLTRFVILEGDRTRGNRFRQCFRIGGLW
jgi:hypothetical protein